MVISKRGQKHRVCKEREENDSVVKNGHAFCNVVCQKKGV